MHIANDLTPEQIDVIKPYEPVLAKAKRINVQANAPKKPEQQQRGAQTYYNPPKFIDTTFEPPSLKALAAKKQIADPVKHVWLKAGYGYKANPLIDFSASTGLSDQINAGIQLKYDAAKGNLENQQHAHIMGRAFGRFVGNNVNIESTWLNKILKPIRQLQKFKTTGSCVVVWILCWVGVFLL